MDGERPRGGLRTPDDARRSCEAEARRDREQQPARQPRGAGDVPPEVPGHEPRVPLSEPPLRPPGVAPVPKPSSLLVAPRWLNVVVGVDDEDTVVLRDAE